MEEYQVPQDLCKTAVSLPPPPLLAATSNRWYSQRRKRLPPPYPPFHRWIEEQNRQSIPLIFAFVLAIIRRCCSHSKECGTVNKQYWLRYCSGLTYSTVSLTTNDFQKNSLLWHLRTGTITINHQRTYRIRYWFSFLDLKIRWVPLPEFSWCRRDLWSPLKDTNQAGYWHIYHIFI